MIAAPEQGRTLWRVGYYADPLGFTPLELYQFSHRFDDVHRRFRTLYCADSAETCLREVLATPTWHSPIAVSARDQTFRSAASRTAARYEVSGCLPVRGGLSRSGRGLRRATIEGQRGAGFASARIHPKARGVVGDVGDIEGLISSCGVWRRKGTEREVCYSRAVSESEHLAGHCGVLDETFAPMVLTLARPAPAPWGDHGTGSKDGVGDLTNSVAQQSDCR